MPAITRDLVAAAAERLKQDGWQFTPRQLYYASCADAETPARSTRAGASGVMGLGVLIALLGLIFIANRYAFLILVTLGAVLVLAGAMLRTRSDPKSGRVLAMSFDDFVRRFCTGEMEGMIDVEASAQPSWLLGGTDRGIVCDTSETAALVNANAHRAGLSHVALSASDLAEAGTWSEAVVLHDASPRGCRLPSELHERGVARVVDAGLRPQVVMHADLQFIEGAPAHVLEAVRRSLSDSEVGWLESGRRLELAVLTPAAVLELVTSALAAHQPAQAVEAAAAG